jgi:hypothetical protein
MPTSIERTINRRRKKRPAIQVAVPKVGKSVKIASEVFTD